jgi:hypothetical protein
MGVKRRVFTHPSMEEDESEKKLYAMSSKDFECQRTL